MFISYAQNFEDLVLWRVLGHVEHGTYVDVGAADPDEFSVTKAFYDRGWSGLDVEPAPHYVDKLIASRPRDIVVPACAGAEDGCAVLHLIDQTGLSTLSSEYLEDLASKDFVHVDLEVSVQRLDRMLEDAAYGDREIQFLKIDVEGGEEAVLRGLDFDTWRPWVVVVEATEPLSTHPTFERWEPLLTSHGYKFCLFDGLNRFYLSPDHLDLEGSLSYPAGVFDQPYTVGHGDRELAAVAAIAVAERDALSTSYRALEEELARTTEGYGRLESKHRDAVAAYEALHGKYTHALTAYDSLHNEYEASVDSYASLHREYEASVDSYASLHREYDDALSGYARLESTYHDVLAKYHALVSTHEAMLVDNEALRAETVEAAARLVREQERADIAEGQRDRARGRLNEISAASPWRVKAILREALDTD